MAGRGVGPAGKPNHRLKMKYGESIAVATGGAFGSFRPNTLFPSSSHPLPLPSSPDKWQKKSVRSAMDEIISDEFGLERV